MQSWWFLHLIHSFYCDTGGKPDVGRPRLLFPWKKAAWRSTEGLSTIRYLNASPNVFTFPVTLEKYPEPFSSNSITLWWFCCICCFSSGGLGAGGTDASDCGRLAETVAWCGTLHGVRDWIYCSGPGWSGQRSICTSSFMSSCGSMLLKLHWHVTFYFDSIPKNITHKTWNISLKAAFLL